MRDSYTYYKPEILFLIMNLIKIFHFRGMYTNDKSVWMLQETLVTKQSSKPIHLSEL